jgi:hypothetical protein
MINQCRRNLDMYNISKCYQQCTPYYQDLFEDYVYDLWYKFIPEIYDNEGYFTVQLLLISFLNSKLNKTGFDLYNINVCELIEAVKPITNTSYRIHMNNWWACEIPELSPEYVNHIFATINDLDTLRYFPYLPEFN